MSLTSYTFFIFCGLIFLLYFTICRRTQWQLLLASSLVFYGSFSLSYLLVLGYVAIVSYYGALLVQKVKRKKAGVTFTVLLLLLSLGLFKYTNFILSNIDSIIHTSFGSLIDLILPVGLSFYTFQAISYVIDVYREEYEPESNALKHLLFISFFPQILQGPISGYVRFKEQMFIPHRFDYVRAVNGTRRFAWGLFKKLVIANRIEQIIATPLVNYTEYGGISFWIVLSLYAIEIYADFSGYMDIMAGYSNILGISVMENFDTPYLSKSVAEFWRRWHISLGEWFRNYLFYPIMRSDKVSGLRRKLKTQGLKRASKTVPTVIALVVVWLATGIWHGASWNYVLWGGYYGFFIILSTLMEPLYLNWRDKHKQISDSRFFNFIRVVRTFTIIVIGYGIFRPSSLAATKYIICSLFTRIDIHRAIGFVLDNRISLMISMFGFSLLIFCDLLKYRKNMSVQQIIAEQPLAIRWGLYFLLFLMIIILGSFSKGAFLYFDF